MTPALLALDDGFYGLSGRALKVTEVGKNKIIDKIKKCDTIKVKINYVNIILGKLSGGFK